MNDLAKQLASIREGNERLEKAIATNTTALDEIREQIAQIRKVRGIR